MDKNKKRAFLLELIDLCHKHQAILVYDGCGSHEIAVEEAKLGYDLLRDFNTIAKSAYGGYEIP